MCGLAYNTHACAHTHTHTLTDLNQPWIQADRQRPDKVERTAWGFSADHRELTPKLNKKQIIKNWKCPTPTCHCNPGLTAQRTPACHTAYQQPNPLDSQPFHLFSCPPPPPTPPFFCKLTSLFPSVHQRHQSWMVKSGASAA